MVDTFLPASEPPKPPAAPPKSQKNIIIVLVFLVGFILFATLVPIVDNTKQPGFKQTLWDVVIGNMGTPIMRH